MERPVQPGGVVPESVRSAAHAAFEARDAHALLLEPAPHGAPEGESEGDVQVFHGVDGEVRVHVTTTGLTVSTDDHVVGVSVEAPGGPAVGLERGPDGDWSLPEVPRGPVSLVVTSESHRSRTPWATLRG